MPQLPANNLRERMLKLGYNPEFVKLTPPTLDNSSVIKKESKPSYVTANSGAKKEPEFINLDDWSDFEEE